MINNEERIKNTPLNKYKEIFGVEKVIFDRMLKILTAAKAFNKETNVGRKPKLEVSFGSIIDITLSSDC